ncbi:MAG: hypothetical protein WC683_03955 [bacterium]
MANKMRYLRGPVAEAYIAKSGTVAIEEGDMLKLNTSGQITPASVSGDSTGLIAVARGASPATDASGAKVPVNIIMFGSVFEFICGTTTAALAFGQALKITGKQTLSKKTATNIAVTGTNAVAIVAEGMAASGSTVKVMFRQTRWAAQINRRSTGTWGA